MSSKVPSEFGSFMTFNGLVVELLAAFKVTLYIPGGDNIEKFSSPFLSLFSSRENQSA